MLRRFGVFGVTHSLLADCATKQIGSEANRSQGHPAHDEAWDY